MNRPSSVAGESPRRSGPGAKRPRILYLTRSWPHGRAFGGQIRSLHVARALRECGDVNVVVVSEDDPEAEALSRTVEEFGPTLAIRPRARPNRGLVAKLRRALDTRYLNVHGCLADPQDRDRIVAAIPQYDLVWVLNSRTPNLLDIWDWPGAHLDIDDIPSGYARAVAGGDGPLVARCKARIEQTLLRRREVRLSDRFASLSVCSEADRSYLGRGARLHVIPNGFERPTGEPVVRRSSGVPRIGFIGLYSYAPNLEGVRWFLQECWPAVQARVPGIRFRLAGRDSDGPLRPKAPQVDALGWIADPAEEIATWSAMIIPVRAGGGTRIKIADALSRKCPVVSTRLGAYGYDLEPGRDFRLADSPSKFAQACAELVLRPLEGEAMADRAWAKFLRQWTWEAIAPKVRAAAEEGLRRNRGW